MEDKDYSKYKLNVVKSPADIRDWKVGYILPKIVLPDELDYRPVMFEIRDQGTDGACAAFAGAAMKEWQERIDVNLKDYMSPQFIYNNREDPTQEGMYMRDLMEILKQKGVCHESLYPYGSRKEMSVEILMNASLYRVLNYASVNSPDESKASLFLNGPTIVALPVYNFGERFWYQYPGQRLLGGHANAKVGYIKEGWVLRNSWGKEWGKNGYSIMPYEDFNLQWEEWSTIDAKSVVPPVDPVVPEPEKKGCFFKFW